MPFVTIGPRAGDAAAEQGLRRAGQGPARHVKRGAAADDRGHPAHARRYASVLSYQWHPAAAAAARSLLISMLLLAVHDASCLLAAIGCAQAHLVCARAPCSLRPISLKAEAALLSCLICAACMRCVRAVSIYTASLSCVVSLLDVRVRHLVPACVWTSIALPIAWGGSTHVAAVCGLSCLIACRCSVLVRLGVPAAARRAAVHFRRRARARPRGR